MGLGDLFQLNDISSLLTALLAIAAAACIISFLRGFFENPLLNPNVPHVNLAAFAPHPAPPAANDAHAAPPRPHQPTSAAAVAAASNAQSIGTITVSAPGSLLEELTPEALSEGATVLPGAAGALRFCASRTSIYILCQVADDIGEAAVRGALEYSGLIGPRRDQIPPQRLLFCETDVGKTSIVRQLEPNVHIDGHASTIEQLQRFVPRLLEIAPSGQGAAVGLGPNISAAATLEEALSLLGVAP